MVVDEIHSNVLMRMLSVTYNTHTNRIIYRCTPSHVNLSKQAFRRKSKDFQGGLKSDTWIKIIWQPSG